MSKAKFELNRAGVAELLKGAAMQEVLTGYADQVRGRCTQGSAGPEEYAVSTKVKGSRAVATVRADSAHAVRSNLKHNTLIKAVGGG